MTADPFLACFMCRHRAHFPELRPVRIDGTVLMRWRGQGAVGSLRWRCSDREACNDRGAAIVLDVTRAAELLRAQGVTDPAELVAKLAGEP